MASRTWAASSAVLRLLNRVLGLIASRRATKRPVASWRDYTRELIWLTIGVVMGAVAALVPATAVLGESLIL